MYWCHSCSNSCACSNNCSGCHSGALEEISTDNNPQSFDPYVVQQKQEQTFYSLDSLYRNAYRDLFEAARERRPEQVRRVTQNGQQIRYVWVLNSTQEEQMRGLTAEEIKEIKTKTIQQQCSICHQTREAEGFVLECNHEFHQQCLTPWISTNATCPTCRFKLVNQ